jgi:DNA-binding MarR family transcriptional regulator
VTASNEQGLPSDANLEKIFLDLRNISHISSMYSKYLQQNLNITTAQLLFLRVLYSHDGLSAGEIGKRIFIRPGTITGIVDRLEAKGLVTRVRATLDRRVVHIHITGAGRRMVEAAPMPIQSRLAANLKRLSSGEVENITRTLDRLIELMQAEEATVEISMSSPETEVF